MVSALGAHGIHDIYHSEQSHTNILAVGTGQLEIWNNNRIITAGASSQFVSQVVGFPLIPPGSDEMLLISVCVLLSAGLRLY